jgi:hypothetical protein
MLQTSAALGWILGACSEWFTAMGFGLAWAHGLTLALWLWVLIVCGVRLGRAKPEEGRGLVLVAASTLFTYLAGLRFDELWYDIPEAYIQSRRAELLSVEAHGVPWVLLLVAIGLVPSALLLARWLRAGLQRSSRWLSNWPANGPLNWPLNWPSLAAGLVAVTYLGLTLLVAVRYGSGSLPP